jgi:hypothetical protein
LERAFWWLMCGDKTVRYSRSLQTLLLNITFQREQVAADCSHLLTLVPRSWIFLPGRWRWYVPPKRQFTQDLHAATFQKTTFFIVTAVKTSDLTKFVLVLPTFVFSSSRLCMWFTCSM